MTQFLNLAILTKKELMQLLIDEKRLSYRRGYKAGAAMRYRHEPKKPEVFIDEAKPISQRQMDILMSKVPLVYGDSLPVKDTLTSEQKGV
jgi:hypothetical protein